MFGASRFAEHYIFAKISFSRHRPPPPDPVRVLSVQQPFAQLLVRGHRRVEARSWNTDYRGVVAIHASKRLPSKDLQRKWNGNRKMAQIFADQGWRDREDLKELPRSAIVGVVTIIGTELSRDNRGRHDRADLFAWNPYSKRFEWTDPDPKTGKVRYRRPLVTPLSVTYRVGLDYLWALREPVEIEPVPDIAGQQMLWNLGESLSKEVNERVERALRGEWRRPEVDRDRRERSIKRFREQWLRALDAEVREIEASVNHMRDVRALEFTAPLEAVFNLALARYLKEYGTEERDGVEFLPVERKMRRVFAGRAKVPRAEFELDLRRHIKREAEQNERSRIEQERRRKLIRMLVDLRENNWDKASDEKLKKKVAETLDRMLFHADRGEDEGDEWSKHGDMMEAADGWRGTLMDWELSQEGGAE